MNRREGIGIEEPDSVFVSIERTDIAMIEVEAQRRQSRDKSTGKNTWQRGLVKNPHYVGLLGELAYAKYFDIPMDWSDGYDDGVDVWCGGWSCQVKTTTTMDVAAIRERSISRLPQLVLFAKWHESRMIVELQGWMTYGQFKKYRHHCELRSGKNWKPIKAELESVEDLKPRQFSGKNAIRYPGGKSGIADSVFNIGANELGLFGGGLFADYAGYCEPFVGGGGMLFHAIRQGVLEGRELWINDIDKSLVDLYRSIRTHPDELIALTMSYTPTVESWYRAKEQDGKIEDPLKSGFAKMVLHYCSHAGLGACAGTPQGGKNQESKYPINCRWKPIKIGNMIKWLHPHLQRSKITNQSVFDMDIDEGTAVFLDPPYVEKGVDLYKHAFGESEHRRLAEMLLSSRFSWWMTYDDCYLVRNLYSNCTMRTVFNGGGNNPLRKNNELVFIREV